MYNMTLKAPIMEMMPMHDCVAHCARRYRNWDEITSLCAVEAYIDTRLLLC